MRLLLLTPHFFPYQNPRAHRWTAIAHIWAAQGWEVHAVCSHHPDLRSSTPQDGIFLHPAGFNSVKEAVYGLFPAAPRRDAPGRSGKFSLFMAAVNRYALKTWYWPDDAWLWIRPARKKARELLHEMPFDAMVSVSLPFSAHWVAMSIKKRYPKLRWLADIGDPLVQSDHPLNNPWLYDKKNRAAELAVLQAADLVAVTNEGLKKTYQLICTETPLHVIPPVASPAGSAPFEKTTTASPLQLGYFGSFFPKIREPEPILRFFEQVSHSRKDWTLHIFGTVFENFWPVFDRFPQLKPHLRFHGTVAREQVIDAMHQMDILVMLGNTTSFQLPSKWADYLVSGRPVLHLLQTPDDPGLELVKNVPGILSIPIVGQNPLPDLDMLRRQQTGSKWKNLFSPSSIANAYAALLKS
ncbi:MAG: hypothetical protein WA004_17900 [Saprospiraceae bacterium]